MSEKIKNLSVATKYEIDDSFDSEKFIKLRMKIMHDGENPNKSFFSSENIDRAKDSLHNIPILAHVIDDEDDNKQFGGHDMDIVEDEMNKDNFRLNFYEQPIGLIPETNNYSYELIDGRNYVVTDGYVYREYSNYAEDIVERDDELKISMEISVDSSAYKEEEEYFDIIDYRYRAITMLNKDFDTGMIDARAKKIEFSINDESKKEFLKLASELKFELENYNLEDNSTAIGGGEENMPEEKYVRSFELSHDDIMTKLYQTLEPIETENNEWYYITDVYDTHFDYASFGQKDTCFRQTYAKGEDNSLEFDGERATMFIKKLTEGEVVSLEQMQTSYESLQENFNALQESFNTQEEELNTLKEFKQNIEIEKDTQLKEDLYSKFNKLLTDEEVEAVREQNLTLEEIEFTLSAKVVENQFSKIQNKQETTKVDEVLQTDNLKNNTAKTKNKYAV